MATPVLVPIAEYLNTTYRPDCDYIDGEVRERNMGEKPHGLLQGILFSIFQLNRKKWALLPVLEQRVQTSSQNYRIPDLCLVHPEHAAERIVSVPPFLCIEILSKDDSLHDMQSRVDDYVAMGVANIWIIDPDRRMAWKASANGYERVPANLDIGGTAISVSLSGIFEELDDLLAGRL